MVLRSVADEHDPLDSHQFPLFLALHALSVAALSAAMWYGLENPNGRRSIARLNTFFRIAGLLLLFLAGFTYARFWRVLA